MLSCSIRVRSLIFTDNVVLIISMQVSLQGIVYLPPHVWKHVISLCDAPPLAILSQVCSAFYEEAKPHLDQLGGKLFGHWKAEFSLLHFGSYPAVLNLTIHPGSVIVGYGISMFNNAAVAYKIFGSRLGRVFSLFLHFPVDKTAFSNLLVTFEYDSDTETSLLKGSFVSLTGTIFAAGKLIGRKKSDSYQPVADSFHEDEVFDVENPSETRRLIPLLSSVLPLWNDLAIFALVGKWNVILLFMHEDLEHQLELTFDLDNFSAAYGAHGDMHSAAYDGEPISQFSGKVLATTNGRNVVGFSIRFFADEGRSEFKMAKTSAIAQIDVKTEETTLVAGSFVSRSEAETEIRGSCFGKKIQED